MNEKPKISDNFEPTKLRDLNILGASRRLEFASNKDAGNIRALIKCADARVHCILPAEDTAHFTSIAAANPAIFESAYCHPAYSSIVDFTHFEGGSGVFPPQGCGGFAEFLKLKRMSDLNTDILHGAVSYVWNEIATADPLYAAFQNAMAIARFCDKPVFFGSLDHLTAQLYISGLAFNDSEDLQYYSPVDFSNYDPNKAYSNGFPTLSPGQIPNEKWAQELVQINSQNAAQQKKIFEANPGFIETQRVQNPSLIFMTTQPHSLRLIVPGIAEVPNSDFALRVLKKKEGNSVAADPTKALAQLEYPIARSIASQDKGSGPFHDTKNLLITTEHIDLSRDIAKKVCEQPYMEPWIEREGKIIVAGVKKGAIQKPSDISFYRP